MSQRLHARLAEHDDERTGVGASATEDILVLRIDVDGNHQTTQDVEQAQTDPDGGHCFGDRATWVLGLGCNEAGVLATGHGKDTCGHDAEEAFEAVYERRRVPVAEADGLGGCSAGGDDLIGAIDVSDE